MKHEAIGGIAGAEQVERLPSTGAVTCCGAEPKMSCSRCWRIKLIPQVARMVSSGRV